MATAAVTYTFANGTNADGTQVNSNFTSVVNFLNTETVQRDASIAFTAIPSLPAVDPTTDNQAVRKAYVDNFLPAGVITQYGASTAPTGWLLCQGQAISRTNPLYTRLFTAISTTYGAGDGTTTFNIPNLQGRIPVGRDSTQTEFDALAETGGSKTSTLTTANLPSHQHGVGTILPNTIADHVHGFGTLATANTDLGSHNHTQNAHDHGSVTSAENNHRHTIGNSLINFAARRGTYQTPGYIAGYDSNGDGLIDGTTSSVGGLALSDGGTYTDFAAAHTHTITSQAATNQTTALGSHLHAISGSVATGGGHTHTMSGSTALEGSGTAFSNLAPYIVVNYIIKL
jgi:microcystin-dependent protein